MTSERDAFERDWIAQGNTLPECRDGEYKCSITNEAYVQFCRGMQAARQDWQPIGTAPKDELIETCGMFLRKRAGGTPKMIRLSEDYISRNAPYPNVKTYHEHEDALGDYTRIFWTPKLPLPPAPKGGDN